MVKRKRSLRLADSDSENRRTTRLSQVQKIPGFKAAVESYGGDSKEGVSVALLDAFLDAHLKDLSGSSMTVIMMYCAEAGIEFLPIVERIRSHVKKTGNDHFAFDLSCINVLGSYVEDHPEFNDELVSLYDEFVSKNHFALSSTEVCKELIRAVSQSTAWMKGVQLLGRLKAAKDDRWSDYYHLISGAAKAGNLDIVLMLQKNFYQAKDTLPTLDGIRNVRTVNMCVIWSTMLDRIDEMQDRGDPSAKIYVEKMLCHWRAIGHIPHVDVINQLSSWFMKYYGDSDVVHLDVKMPKNGECPITSKSLERLVPLEFDRLRAKFMDDVLMKKNIYINADPEDMSGLSNFIKTCAPFDVVIDGLNVCYYGNQLESSPHLMMRQVLQVVKFLRFKMGKRVAVISRDWWDRAQYKPIINELREHASIFMTHRMTQDDLFTLHCCLESGPHCYIVSNDLMRDHRSKWNDEQRPAFGHWQHARQINIHYDEVRNKLELVTPRQYLTVVQEVDGTLFIPHHNATEADVLSSHTRVDLKDSVSIDKHLRIPNSFLVINPEKSFFQTQTMPSWGTI